MDSAFWCSHHRHHRPGNAFWIYSLLGTWKASRIQTSTAYHPQSVGMLERWHWRREPSWFRVFPFVLLGLRTAVCEEFAASSAEMVYGEKLWLPGDLVRDKKDGLGETGLLRLPWEVVPKLKSSLPSRHTQLEFHPPGEFEICTHVLVRTDALWNSQQPPYEGPYKVFERGKLSSSLDIRRWQALEGVLSPKPLDFSWFSLWLVVVLFLFALIGRISKVSRRFVYMLIIKRQRISLTLRRGKNLSSQHDRRVGRLRTTWRRKLVCQICWEVLREL